MKTICWIIGGFLALAMVSGAFQPPPTPSIDSVGIPRRIDKDCSVKAVPMPEVGKATTLKACHAEVRAYMRAIITNVRVTASCWDEFVQRNDSGKLPSGLELRDASRKLLEMIPELEVGAREQLKARASTLDKCRHHLSLAQRLVVLQPELKGDWQPRSMR